MSETICLDKVLTPQTEANTVLREPPCGPISISKLRASEIARRRTKMNCPSGASTSPSASCVEEERAEAIFLCERRRRRRIQSAMRE
jgi:hypothetical protein